MSFRTAPFLQKALLADAVATAATGLLLAALAGWQEPLLALPVPLARWAGLALLPWAAFVLRLGRSEEPDRAAVVAVIAGNAIWTAASVALAVSGWLAPTALGTAFVVLQALVVAGFAEAQWIGLRRSAVPAIS
jgi:hypothetical protein